jgi:hypothetical protein
MNSHWVTAASFHFKNPKNPLMQHNLNLLQHMYFIFSEIDSDKIN